MGSGPRWILFPDVAEFAAEMLRSEDIDPVYPVLRTLESGMDRKHALWFSLLYVAFYDIGSALSAFEVWPDCETWISPAAKKVLSKLPVGIERRGLRTWEAMDKHLFDLADWTSLAGKDQFGYLDDPELQGPADRYERAFVGVQIPWGNGRWAAFKTCEILRRVHDFAIEAPDLRLQYCSGPREGLCWLMDVPESSSLPDLNNRALDLRFALAQQGARLDWEHLETVLCNFNSLRKGHYYIGHDIDEMQERSCQALHSHLSQDNLNRLWNARAAVVPREYLGEFNGWHGVDRARMKVYRDVGKILTRREK